MNIECPHCSQLLEVDADWSGLEVTCPACGNNLLIAAPDDPAVPEPDADPQPEPETDAAFEPVPPHSVADNPTPHLPPPGPAPRSTPRSSGNRQLKAWKRAQMMRRVFRFIVFIALVGGAAWWFNDWRGERPVGSALSDLAERALEVAKKWFGPAAPTPPPTPVRTPTPTPEPSPSPTPTPEPEPSPTPPDPLDWLLKNPDRWPEKLTLAEDTEFKKFEGKSVIKLLARKNASVEVLEITPDDVQVAFAGAKKRVPHAATDLLAAAATEMAAPPPAPTPTPVFAMPKKPVAAPTPRAAVEELGAILARDKGGKATGTTFRVWAPNATSVDVIGTFNRWKPAKNAMKKDDQTGIWSGFVPEAAPGDEYLFVVNGQLERRDPRGRLVSAEGKSVIYDPLAFDWGDVRDWKSNGNLEDLVIYQLHPGTFNDPDALDGRPGTLLDAAAKLDHLKELGINCVLLMPVNEFPGDGSWGYNPTDLFAIEAAYGGPDALKEFVKQAHERGIAVHVDIVHNHYDRDSGLAQFDGYGGGDTRNGIYFYEDKERSTTPWGPRPNYGAKEVRDFIADQVRMWFDEYKIDGLRWDAVGKIRRFGRSEQENPEGERLLDEVSRMIRDDYPGKVSIAEDSVGDGRFDSSWEYGFHHEGTGRSYGVVPQLVAQRTSVSDIARRIDSPLGFHRVIYTENHDETGFLNGNRRLIADVDESDPHSLEARRKAALAAVLTLTSPGIPLVFMGQELLEDKEFHDSNPLDWQRGQVSARASRLYRDLVHLRRNLDGHNAGLTDMRTAILETDEQKKLLAYRRFRLGQPGGEIAVVINFSGEPIKDYPFVLPKSGDWNLLINTDDPKYGEDFTGVETAKASRSTPKNLLLNLAPYSAQIFGPSKFDASDDTGAGNGTQTSVTGIEDTAAVNTTQ